MNINSRVKHLALLTSLIIVTSLQAETDPTGTSQALEPYPPLQAFNEVLQRPLFNAQRKAAPNTATSNGDEKKLRETWKLTGITMTSDLTMALFQERNGDKRLRLETGMPLDESWQLEEITADGVSVSSGNKLIQLDLRQPREAPQQDSSTSGKPTNNGDPVKKSANDTRSGGTDSPQSKTDPTQSAVTRDSKIQTM